MSDGCKCPIFIYCLHFACNIYCHKLFFVIIICNLIYLRKFHLKNQYKYKTQLSSECLVVKNKYLQEILNHFEILLAFVADHAEEVLAFLCFLLSFNTLWCKAIDNAGNTTALCCLSNDDLE